jgi:hypothetical protein
VVTPVVPVGEFTLGVVVWYGTDPPGSVVLPGVMPGVPPVVGTPGELATPVPPGAVPVAEAPPAAASKTAVSAPANCILKIRFMGFLPVSGCVAAATRPHAFENEHQGQGLPYGPPQKAGRAPLARVRHSKR